MQASLDHAGARIPGHNFVAPISWLALRMEEFDGDVVEGDAGIGAGDVREVARRVADLAIGHDDVEFRFVDDGVDEVGFAKRYVDIRKIVLVKERGAACGDANAENVDVGILEDEVVVRFLGDRHGRGCLCVLRKGE